LGEERIKSALEIAMEKISGLPELTPEEIIEQKEKEYGPMGESIAQRYLDGRLSDSEMPAELGKYSGEEGLIVRRALVAGLCNELRLDNDGETAGKALQAMKQLTSEKKRIEQVVKDFLKIFSEFAEEREEKFREFAVLAGNALESRGISGSAVRPNMNENRLWQEELGRIRNESEPRLRDLRNKLMQELQTV
jgi:hypothetical protein